MKIKNYAYSLLPKTGQRDSEPAKKPWGPFSSVVLTVVMYFVAQILAGVLILLYPLAKGWNEAQTQYWFDTSVAGRFWLILLIEGITIAAVYFALTIKRQTLRNIGIKKPKWADLGYALAGFGTYFLCYMTIFFLIKTFIPAIDLEQKQQIGFDTYQEGPKLLLTFISLVILPPIAEEILVRGFLLTGLRTKLAFWRAALVASTVFAIAHLQIGAGAPLLWAAAIDTFILSMVLSFIREERKSLVAPILIHMLKNMMAFSLLFIFKIG